MNPYEAPNSTPKTTTKIKSKTDWADAALVFLGLLAAFSVAATYMYVVGS
jgi:hypothetical protein